MSEENDDHDGDPFYWYTCSKCGVETPESEWNDGDICDTCYFNKGLRKMNDHTAAELKKRAEALAKESVIIRDAESGKITAIITNRPEAFTDRTPCGQISGIPFHTK